MSDCVWIPEEYDRSIVYKTECGHYIDACNIAPDSKYCPYCGERILIVTEKK